MKGPRPIPIRLKMLRGNPGKRALPKEPKVDRTIPEPPAHLTEAARAEWERIVPQLSTAGLLTQLDRAALSAYCVAYGRWSEAEAAVREKGVLVKAPSGYPILSPYLTIANKAMEQMTKLLCEFGMSPSSRARVGAPEERLEEAGDVPAELFDVSGGS